MYVELHAHSAFSFLDGASAPDELVASAISHGYEAMALTDHNAVCGSMEFAQAAAGLGLRAIHGAELDVVDRDVGPAVAEGSTRHLTVLVENERGWRNLCRVITRAHAYDRAGRPGKQPPPAVPLAFLEEHAEGLVCLSGCARQGVRDEPTMRRLLAAFGRDRFRVELQRPFQRHDRALNRGLAALAARLGVPCVATGNVHAHSRARAPLQDAFTAIREHATLDESEPLRRGNWSHVLAGPAAMAARFEDHPDAVAESRELADRLRFDLTADLGYRYPGAEDAGALRQLGEVCWAAFEQRYGEDPRRAEAVARLEQELRIIDTLGLAGFFILHRDLLELARDVAVEVRGPSVARGLLPPGRGRGSSVSSIVCYLTGLSHIDPIRNELFLGRFLNEELTSLPDIDIDFPRDVREALLPRVHERYGRDRSAIVAAFPTFRVRGAVRELGKVLGLPPGEIERVARGAEPWPSAARVGSDIASSLGRPAGGPADRWAWLASLCDDAYGLPRHLSQHSGGVIISTKPLIDCCPVLPAAMEGRQLCQWDKDSCADAGFLKIDVLGLGMLSAVERCVDEIARTRGELIDLSRIPFDDGPTYAAIQAAETTGVFQIESRAQMASLRRTLPASLDDLTIQVAIVRPGPILGGAVNPYISRLQKLRADPSFQVPYEHPSLEPVLRDTLGAIIFQDQVIEVAMAFAGFSPGEAEGLRRAMSRKRSAEAIEAYHERFVEGAARTHGADAETAERVFSMVQGFSGFGFPKAHGAAFGLLAYQSTWLRVHYGPEFLCALLNEQPMGFYPPDTLSHEAARRGIPVRPPCVNASGVECTVEPDGGVRIGLGYLNGARRDEVSAIVASRIREGPFTALADLASRAGAGRPALEVLAWSGACDSLLAPSALTSDRRRQVLWQLGVAAPGERVVEGTQLALPLGLPAPPELRALDPWQSMIADYATTGLTLGPHPLEIVRPTLPAGTVSSRDLERIPHESPVRVGGLVVARQRPSTAKGIVFLLLEDEFGTINFIVPPEIYERHRLAVRTEPLLLIDGRLERHPIAGGQINVLVTHMRAIDAPDAVLAEVHDLLADRPATEPEVAAGAAVAVGAAGGGDESSLSDFRAVAPPILSFAAGRRR